MEKSGTDNKWIDDLISRWNKIKIEFRWEFASKDLNKGFIGEEEAKEIFEFIEKRLFKNILK